MVQTYTSLFRFIPSYFILSVASVSLAFKKKKKKKKIYNMSPEHPIVPENLKMLKKKKNTWKT